MSEGQTVYEVIGGEEGVRKLVNRFYELMDTLPEGQAARAIHPSDLSDSNQKLFEYFSGWLGGPQLFVERRGPPMLRARHLHAPIAAPEIQSWLACFMRAWREVVGNRPDIDELVLPQIHSLAQHMRNKQDEKSGE
jgi:hemoglobin